MTLRAGGGSDQEYNIGFCFGRLAAELGDRNAMTASDLSLTYDQLWQIAQTFGLRLREQGVGRDSIVALDTRDMVFSLGTMFATALLGARFVELDNALLDRADLQPTHFLCSPDRTPKSGLDYLEIESNWSPKVAGIPDESVARSFEGYVHQDDPWWIIHTSGTTGRPKFMQLSQRIVFERSMAASPDFQRGVTVFCSLFTCHTRPFYVRAAAALLNGCHIVDSIDPDFMRQKGVNLVCGSPGNTRKWLKDRHITPKLPRLQVSGARLSDQEARSFLQSFDEVEDVYGSSETNKTFVNSKKLVGSELISTGLPSDSRIEIRNSASDLCKIGEIGSVRVKNSYMVPGYVGDPEASARSFRDGWFHPGDMGTWGARGELLITGREDELVNIGGDLIDPAQVEEALRSGEGIGEAACFADPREDQTGLVAFVTLSQHASPDAAVGSAHTACVERLGGVAVPSLILVVKKIPITLDGTPRRKECQNLALPLLASAQYRTI